RRSPLRDSRRLRSTPRRGARARHPRPPRLGPEPHLRPASVVPRVACLAREPEARPVRLARPRARRRPTEQLARLVPARLARTHARYYGHDDELHLVFGLPAAVLTPWDAAAWRERIADVAARLDPVGAWPTWVLSNHDVPRHRTRFGSEAAARAAAVLLLTLRGTPFLYQGEELGLEDAAVPPERAVDPGGRDGCRGPIPWDARPEHGWPAPPGVPLP